VRTVDIVIVTGAGPCLFPASSCFAEADLPQPIKPKLAPKTQAAARQRVKGDGSMKRIPRS
jgi:hypothetical protein